MKDSINTFLELLHSSLNNSTFVKMSFGKPTQKESPLRKVSVRLIEVKGTPHCCFSFETTTQNTNKNFSFSESVDEATNLIGSQFKNINLFTTENDHTLLFSKKLIPKLISKTPTFSTSVIQPHNREKQRFIQTDDNIYLKELGITTQDGTIIPKRQNKFKQIDKFIEVIDSLINSSFLKNKSAVHVADMGSGKGYLTFALYDYLTNSLHLPVHVTGIEFRNELVDLCNAIAKKSHFEHLHFSPGTIQENSVTDIDLLIALHACDTATDDAIAKGIAADASIIITAPCCHKQIRKAMNVNSILGEITRYGILKERQAEMITDTIRALILESKGYKTQIFEFIADAHTHKNVMITAVKKAKHVDPEPYIKKIQLLKQQFGIDTHYLETIL